MKKVFKCSWALLLALLLISPFTNAEDINQPVVESPVAVEETLDENLINIPETDIENVGQTVQEEAIVYLKILFDSDMDGYDPNLICEEIRDGKVEGDTTIEMLNDLYHPWVQFKSTDSLNDSWERIGEETNLAMGDILACKDFSKVGIWLENDEVFSLTKEKIQSPAGFTYYNKTLHAKNHDIAEINNQPLEDEPIFTELETPQENEPVATDLEITNDSQEIEDQISNEVILTEEQPEDEGLLDMSLNPTPETQEAITEPIPETVNEPEVEPVIEPAIEPTIVENVIAEPITEEVTVEESVDPVAETNVDPAMEQPVETPAEPIPVAEPIIELPVVEPITELLVVPATSPSSPYFSLVFDDKDFRTYCPLNVNEQIEKGDIEKGDIEGVALIEQLQGLYAKGIEFVPTDSVDRGWAQMEDETRYILGDILVSEDFSVIGIWISKDEVFCLNDNVIKATAEFFYYNQAFQSKTIQEVW